MSVTLLDALYDGLRQIRILARRYELDTGGVEASVPMLRGVWGAALHDLDPTAYRVVFHPQESPGEEASPAYIVRSASSHDGVPALEWISIEPALAFDRSLNRAWDVASGLGLGPQRRRFHLRQERRLGPDGRLAFDDAASAGDPFASAWSLDRAVLPLADPEKSPCRLEFRVPVRLRRRGRLIEAPTCSDLIVAAVRRVRAYLPEASRAWWDSVGRAALDEARRIPSEPWRGARFDLQRYSASQRAELELQGVVGRLDLPAGLGPLYPLFAAADWIHLGKSTVLGLGRPTVVPVAA